MNKLQKLVANLLSGDKESEWEDFYLYGYRDGLKNTPQRNQEIIADLCMNRPQYDPARRRTDLQIDGFSAALKKQLEKIGAEQVNKK